jgi:hypothetical protein
MSAEPAIHPAGCDAIQYCTMANHSGFSRFGPNDRLTYFDRFCRARGTDLKGYRFPRARAQEHDSCVLCAHIDSNRVHTTYHEIGHEHKTRVEGETRNPIYCIQAQHSRRLRNRVQHKHKSDKTHVEEGDRNRVYIYQHKTRVEGETPYI